MSKMNQEKSDPWYNLLFLASIAISCIGVAGLIFVFFNIPRLSPSLPVFLEVVLYIFFSVIGPLLILGMYRERKWVLHLVFTLLVIWVSAQVAALIIYKSDLATIAINVFISIFVSAFILWILTRPSMKRNFST